MIASIRQMRPGILEFKDQNNAQICVAQNPQLPEHFVLFLPDHKVLLEVEQTLHEGDSSVAMEVPIGWDQAILLIASGLSDLDDDWGVAIDAIENAFTSEFSK